MMVVRMTAGAITAGGAEPDNGEQQGDDEQFLFHNRDFKSVQKLLSPIGAAFLPHVY
jgi:hypothetical protein